MDLIGDILKTTGMRGRVLGVQAIGPETQIEFPCERSIGFHLVTRGFIRLVSRNRKGREVQLVLEPGDCAVMSRGVHHSIRQIADRADAIRSNSKPSRGRQQSSSQSSNESEVVSGAYQFWHDPIHPFLRELPDWYVLRAKDYRVDAHLSDLVRLVSYESRAAQLGSNRVLENSMEILLTLIFRRIIEETNQTKKTWSRAVSQEGLRNVLEIMHAEPQKNWTVSDLAKAGGYSRSAFAAKFKNELGKTPLQYLSLVRIQKACELLIREDSSLQTIASLVGYSDSFSFSKAFKKNVGVSPQEFRKKDKLALGSEWRWA